MTSLSISIGSSPSLFLSLRKTVYTISFTPSDSLKNGQDHGHTNGLPCPDLEDLQRPRAPAVKDKTKPKLRWKWEERTRLWNVNAKTEWLIKDLLVQSSVTLLTGDSGLGKSTLVLAMAGQI